MKVSVVMGSVSDFDSLKEMLDFFKEMDIEVSLRALSAHRTPGELIEYLTEMENEVEVFIAAAGKAAHLPGVVASKTLKPVIGIPVKASTLDGLDALLSIVQMPKGVPVATVAIDGSLNAEILAEQIKALKDEKTAVKLKEYKNKMRLEVLSKEQDLLKSKGY